MKPDYDRIAAKAFHFPSLITDKEALILNERANPPTMTAPTTSANTPDINAISVGCDVLFDDLWRLCNGCLKSAIVAHGPITKENYGSAGKRIAGQLQALVAQWIEHGDSTSGVAGSIPAEGTIHSANKGNEFWWLPKKNKHENRPDNQNGLEAESSL